MSDNEDKRNGFDEMKWQCDNCKRDNVTGREYTYYRNFKCSECREESIAKIKADYEKSIKKEHDSDSSSGCLLSPLHVFSSSSSFSDSGECVIS